MAEANGVMDEGFLGRYRQLLDAEDAAFDELEHAVEDGDRVRYERDLEQWQSVVERRIGYLERQGLLPLGSGISPGA